VQAGAEPPRPTATLEEAATAFLRKKVAARCRAFYEAQSYDLRGLRREGSPQPTVDDVRRLLGYGK
jgi:hypothetical protein